MNYRTKLAAAQQSYEAGYTLAKIAMIDEPGFSSYIPDLPGLSSAASRAREHLSDLGGRAREHLPEMTPRRAAAAAAALGVAGLGAGGVALHRHRQNVAREALKKKLLMGAGGAALLGGGGLLAHHLMSGHDEE